MEIAVTIALLASFLSCYFAACQAVLKTFSRKRLADVLQQKGKDTDLDRLAERLPKLQLVTGIARSVFTMLVLLATLYAVEVFVVEAPHRLGLVSYGVAFVIGGALITFFSVAIAASWARYRREKLLAWSLPILDGLLWIMTPVINLLHLTDPVIRRISGVDLEADHQTDISDEVLTVVEDHDVNEQVDEEQKDMLEAVFELPNTDAGEVMTPRTDMHGLSVDANLEQAKQTILKHGHSRIPVYTESLDHIAGILYAKDLIAFVGDESAFALRDILREAFFVPETKSISALLAEFKARKVHLAIVLDEYGGTAGLVTIEDIIEELIGEIQDEYEKQEQPVQFTQIDPNTAEVDARMRIDELNDAFDLALDEEEDYDTVGGFVFAELGHIPKPQESFEVQQLRFTVTAVERTKVLRVRIERVETMAHGRDGREM